MDHFPLDGRKAKELLQQGKALHHFKIKDLNLANLIFDHDISITDCLIENFSATNCTFNGKVNFSQTCFGSSDPANESAQIPTVQGDSIGEEGCFNKATFKDDACFDDCLFYKPANFSNAEFKKEATFRNARFKGETHFINAVFDGFPSFGDAVFENEINFSSTQFGEEVNFRKAHFLGLSDFTDARFGSSEFEECEFQNAIFRFAKFGSWADFSKTLFFNDADFISAVFENGADFSEAHFKNKARFEKCRFKTDCYFVETHFFNLADFSSVTVLNGADFKKCIFEERAEFSNAEIHEGVFALIQCIKPVLFSGLIANQLNFQQAQFQETFNFSNTEIKGNATFDQVIFKKWAVFDHSKFQYASFRQTEFVDCCQFRAARFRNKCTFRDATFNNEADFSGAHFKGSVNFYNAKFKLRSYFLNTHFYKNVLFEDTDFRERVDFSDAAFHRGICITDLRAEDVILNWSQIEGKICNVRNKRFDLARKEYGLLKNLFEKQNKYEDMDQAYRMFKRMERKSNRSSLKHPIALLKKAANLIILDLGAGYGTRPFNIAIMTLIVIVLFGCFYFLFNDQIIVGDKELHTLKNFGFCLYYSFISFVTLGAENLYPNYSEWLKYVVAVQAFTGFFLMTLFVATFTRKVIR